MKKNLEIHSENILPIIKKWLYTDHDIFLRELISNACDACEKLKRLGKAQDFAIHVRIDQEKKTLEIEDNGIGMTQDEVEKYIAQIAFSGAEEFVKHYASGEDGEQLIGHFGLGFYSSYMVAHTVELETKSYQQDAHAVLWSCDGSKEYDMEPSERSTRGTLVRLHIQEEEYLQRHKIESLLKTYCKFLPVPIFFEDKQINDQEPLWIKKPSDCSREEYLSFYRLLYPMQPDPLFWIHLNVDYPFNLKGILYFPKVQSNTDFQKHTVELYCSRVFVAPSCKDILPEYLTHLRGVIDSPDIPLNVSRSALQMNPTIRQLGTHISKKVSDALNKWYQDTPEEYVRAWDDLAPIVKIGSIEDEKFYARVQKSCIYPLTDASHMSVSEYAESGAEKLIYTKDQRLHEDLRKMYEDKGDKIFVFASPLDTYMLQVFEKQHPTLKLFRIDGQLDDALLDPTKEKSLLDAQGRSEASKMAEFFKNRLDGVEVEAKSLKSQQIPALCLFKEEERRMRDFLKTMHPDSPIPTKPTFVINTNNPLIEKITQVQDPELAKELAQQVYQLSLLSQKELDMDEMHQLVTRSTQLLEKLL